MELKELLSGMGVVMGLVCSPFLIKAVITISRDWGTRGLITENTAVAVGKIASSFDAFSHKVEEQHLEINERLARSEFILTGDQGLNGIRGEVKDIKNTLFQQNEESHVRLAELSKWQIQTDNALEQLDNRIPERRTRRVSTRKGGRRRTDPK